MKRSGKQRSTILRSVSRCTLAVAALAVAASADWPLAGSLITPALAQRVAVREDFRVALSPYGSWRSHSRWGEVWVPTARPVDWRPYTDGRWAYTDDWGWYWVSNDDEDAWGWIVYHYGHWVLDADLGWIWVPGDEWGPGWVQWRRGGDYMGWAPLPPDEVVVTYRDEPDVWVFVRGRDFVAPRIEDVILPEREYSTFVRDTVVENRTVEFRDQHFAVNPGIAPDIVAAEVGHSIRAFDVHPHVLAGTARINGAVEVRGDELTRLRGDREAFRDTVRESQRQFTPTRQVPPPQALGANERGRLGNNPPRAVPRGALANGPQEQPQRNAPPSTQGRTQERTQERNQPQQGIQQGRTPQQPPATQGLGTPNQRDLQRQQRGIGANQGGTPQPRGPGQGRELQRGGPSDRTQGLAPEERRTLPQGGPNQGPGRGPDQTNRQQQRGPLEGQGGETQRGGPPSNRTQGLAPEERRSLPQGGANQGPDRGFDRGTPPNLGARDNREPQGRQPELNRQPPTTQGLAPREGRQPGLPPQGERQLPRGNPGGTEGFAGQRAMPPPQTRAPQPQMQPQQGGGPGGRGRRPGE